MAFLKKSALSLVILVCLALPGADRESAATPILAVQDKTGKPENPDAPAVKDLSLDQLYDRLVKASNAEDAKPYELMIRRMWLESGSPTTDLLMARVVTAIEAKQYPVALDLLDRIVRLKPGYAEGWNKRATVYFLQENYARSISDIERALKLEPRHFGALSGLAIIFEQLGQEKRALELYRRVLAVYPTLDNARSAVEKLAIKVEGKDI